MTTFRSEDVLVGIIGLALLPMIGLRLWRGLREGRLPIYRTYLHRDENKAKFGALVGIHVISFLLVAAIAADLLLSLGLRDAL
jgi:hypothetical protein